MPDREKVVRELETIRFNLRQMKHNLLADYCDNVLALLKEQENDIHHMGLIIDEYEKELNKSIALLKEQEAVKPKSKSRHGANAQIQHFCGNCNSMLHGKPKFCSECGKGVLW